MNRIDLTQIPTYLKAQRWFGGKAWPIKQVSVRDQVPVRLGDDDEGALLVIVDVTYELGQPERYMLPILPKKQTMVDACDNDGFLRALIRLVAQNQTLPSGSGALKGERLPGSEKLLASLGEEPALRRMGVEQTNTSISFEDKVMLKLLRKLEPGVNPEYEMGQFLHAHGFDGAPQLLGGLRLDGPTDSLVAVAHAFEPAESDGWIYLLKGLRESRSPSPALLSTVKELGERVAQMHQVLASDTDDPGFSPEPILTEDLQRWSSSIIGELGVTMNLAGDQVPGLTELRNTLVERVHRLAHVHASGQKTRVHGDLHLGQVLRSRTRGWVIFDFEGEPARGFAQRREKISPLKDVAGMLRSFAYAVATVEREGLAAGDRVTPLRKAFLEGYFGKARGSAFLPTEEASREILDALELEKLLYELRYEVQHRPDWVQIPAASLKNWGQ